MDSDVDFELESVLPSLWSRAASTSPEHPKSTRSYRCVGLALDGEEEGEMDGRGAVVAAAASVPEEMLVGHAFGSPLGVMICAPDGSL